MELVQPEARGTDQKAAHLVASVIVDDAFPVRVHALPGVFMLVKMGSVEKHQAMFVAGKMRRHPVQDDADAVLVQVVDQKHEILRGAVAAGGCKEPQCLVSPGAVEGVLHYRQELHMGEPHGQHILGERSCHLRIGEKAVAVFRHPAPGAQMNFIDRYG